jgi:hypothetical protein
VATAGWSKVNLILQGIEYHFGSYVFTPVDKQRLFPRSWPSFRQLNAAGKRGTRDPHLWPSLGHN